MARGMQKIQAQQKAAGKKKNGAGTQKGMADKAMKYKCKQCMTIMVDIKQYKAHWESKHTKNGAFPEAE